ncbi:hypothetical protein IV203_014346 [Nitzschia inconspicua]|uniref:Uncharacterized protein n=1 Tax=Nitzschia inconspicua TaxID=303405 RepID=A0A9K3PSH1_9STRA|nr:hypothetical protein IV203_024983 [Nitzschia inconspicua]KAG7357735.1 hypothetical protein IV203_014322 [Nitzschia inconspicua]KAG7357746.1 hypothetical protein IV203_014333 [Nitzschia inconspicua]KAG7357759.1 hypothetical protein IV203_014346 [Nitzschia inconspicua]
MPRTEEDTCKRGKPEYLILDVTIVTGMDTSTVDLFFWDTRNLCRANKCNLLIACIDVIQQSDHSALRTFKTNTGIWSKRELQFCPNLDASLGKVEALLLETKYIDSEPQPSMSNK